MERGKRSGRGWECQWPKALVWKPQLCLGVSACAWGGGEGAIGRLTSSQVWKDLTLGAA